MSRGPAMKLDEMLLDLHHGDSAAQQEFEHDYSGPMLRRARGCLRNHLLRVAEAEDIWQAVVAKFFARAVRCEIHAETPEKLVSFVAAMIRFEIRHENRHDHAARRDARRLEDAPVEECDICSREPDPSRAAELRELWEMCADELGGEDSFIVYEHVREGRTFREIAEILEKKKDAVKVQHQRALQRLRAKFGHLFDLESG